MLIPRLGKPHARTYVYTPAVKAKRKRKPEHNAEPLTRAPAPEPVAIPAHRGPDFLNSFKLVGYVGTIRADRRDADLMTMYARARAREEARHG